MTLVQDFFGSIICINLDRRTDRWAEACTEFEQCGIDRYERFAGVEMREAPVAGCTASHRAIWRRVAAGECGERPLIFEDDFMFTTREMLLGLGGEESAAVRLFDSCPGLTLNDRFEAMEPYLPKSWDLLYLGGGYIRPARARVNRRVIRNGGMLTAHAYSVGREFAAKMTATLDRAVPPPAVVGCAPDSLLAEYAEAPEVRSYTLIPRLFIQRPTSPSDLDPKPLDGFPWSMIDSAHEEAVSEGW